MSSEERRDRVRRLGGLVGDAKAGYDGYRKGRRLRRALIAVAALVVGLIVVLSVAGGFDGDDDDDSDGRVTGPVPVQVDDADDDD